MNFASSFHSCTRKFKVLSLTAVPAAALDTENHSSHRSQFMLPYWIELSPADLIQGTAVLTLVLAFLVGNLSVRAGR